MHVNNQSNFSSNMIILTERWIICHSKTTVANTDDKKRDWLVHWLMNESGNALADIGELATLQWAPTFAGWWRWWQRLERFWKSFNFKTHLVGFCEPISEDRSEFWIEKVNIDLTVPFFSRSVSFRRPIAHFREHVGYELINFNLIDVLKSVSAH